MFCAPGLAFCGTVGVGFCFHVLRSRTRFRRYRGRQVSFSCFAPSDTFSTVPKASGPVFMFYARGLVFGGTEGVGFRFHDLCSRTHFRGYRGRRVLFSFFALPASLSAVRWASSPVFMFCVPELVFGGTDGVGSRFHFLHSPAPFRRCGRRRVPFSCFAPPDSFSTVTRASGPVLMFCALVLVFGSTEGVGSQFSCFTLPDSF
jgi:hypothetical protein